MWWKAIFFLLMQAPLHGASLLCCYTYPRMHFALHRMHRRKGIAVAVVVSMFVMAGAALAWDLSTASYDSVSFSIGGQDTAPVGIAFKSDGTKLYVIGQSSDRVYQYSLSSAWNLSTASYDSISFDISGQEATSQGLAFKSDGTKMYVIGSANDTVYQYSLSSAWNLSTASYDSLSFNVGGQDTFPGDFTFKSDGTKMYVLGDANDTVYQYSLSSSWNVSTASYDSVSFSVSGQDTTIRGLAFKSDGTKMYVSGVANQRLYQYSLSSAWNLSTASYDSVSSSVGGQDTVPMGVTFKSDGTKMYMVGSTNDTVYQYSVIPPDTTPPSVSTLSPADNATGVSTTANLVITFDEATRAGTGTLAIKKTSDNSTVETITVSGALLSGNGTTSLTLNPSTTLVESTSYYVTWTANAFKDASSNHVAAQTSTTYWNFTTLDATSPSVSTLSPADNATGVSVTANLVLTFDETVRAGTGTLVIKTSTGGTTVETITVSGALLSGNGSTQLTLNPATTLSGSTAYYITWAANAFKDTSSNHAAAVTSSAVWNFTTADITRPTVSSLSPVDGSTDVSLTANLVITFSEAVQGSTGSLLLKKSSDDSTIETIAANGALVSGSGTAIMTINPSVTLANGTAYYITIGSNAFQDGAGNEYAGMSNSTSWNFTTVAAAATSSSSTSTQATVTSTGGRRGSTLTMTQRIQMARAALFARVNRQKLLQTPRSLGCTSKLGRALRTKRCVKR
jgi:sugar lactone lactonase YvrE/methionine-rich copper-binding protein CopC